MTDIEKLEGMIAVAHNLLELSKQQHNAAGDRLRDFERGIRQLDNSRDDIKSAVSMGVVAGMNKAIMDSLQNTPATVELLCRRLDEKTEAAVKATEQLKQSNDKANKQSTLKMIIIPFGIFLAMIAPLYLVIEWQLHRLDVIQENIASFDALKGQVVIQNCNGQPCVAVNKSTEYGGKLEHLFVLEGVKFKDEVKPKNEVKPKQ